MCHFSERNRGAQVMRRCETRKTRKDSVTGDTRKDSLKDAFGHKWDFAMKHIATLSLVVALPLLMRWTGRTVFVEVSVRMSTPRAP